MTKSLKIKNILLIFLIITISLYSETKQHIIYKKDSYGRTYGLKWNGEIVWNLDDNYFLSNVNSSQLDVHLEEAIELEKNRNILNALRVYGGVIYCNKIIDKKENFRIINKASEKRSNLINKYLDKLEQFSPVLEPQSCEVENEEGKSHSIENTQFGVRIDIPGEFEFILPKDLKSVKEETPSFKTVNRMFYKWDNKPLPEMTEQRLLNILSGKIADFYYQYSRINIFYTDFKKDKPTEKKTYLFFDAKRGLTNNIKKKYNFIREFNENYSSVRFKILEPDGVETEYNGFEKIIIQKNQAVSIFYHFPVSEKDNASKNWNFILSKIRLKSF